MSLPYIGALLIEALGYILEALGLMGTVLTVVNFIKAEVPTFAREHIQYLIEGKVGAIDDAVNGGPDSLATIHTAVSSVLTIVSDMQTHYQQSGSPVTLPTVPPSGYGGADIVSIADQVWNGAQTILPSTPGDALLQVARALNTSGDFDFPFNVGIFRVSRIDWPAAGFYIHDLSYPTFDPTAILSTDTLFSYLTRANPDWNVGYGWGPQTYVTLDWNGTSQPHYTTVIDEAGFTAMKASLGLVPVSVPAPVWPGLAKVTLGSTVDLAEGLTITAPMHGVIVSLTTEPARSGYYAFDDARSYRNLGALSFFDDNGELEFAQSFGFTAAVYSPKSMAIAAGVKVRTTGGVAGTVTPWVIA